ncbi:MAG: hypothetical protein GY832_24835 [Chloroflexi bacterium]|nr:hypothetical protein [Chloroflexota bacterium]
MDKQIQWITYKEKRVLFNNYAGLRGDDYIAAIEETKQELLRHPKGSVILTLTDVSDSVASPDTSKKAKELTAATKGNEITTIAATVGMTGIKKSLAQFIRKDVHFSDSIQEAKDWLVEQADS